MTAWSTGRASAIPGGRMEAIRDGGKQERETPIFYTRPMGPEGSDLAGATDALAPLPRAKRRKTKLPGRGFVFDPCPAGRIAPAT